MSKDGEGAEGEERQDGGVQALTSTQLDRFSRQNAALGKYLGIQCPQQCFCSNTSSSMRGVTATMHRALPCRSCATTSTERRHG